MCERFARVSAGGLLIITTLLPPTRPTLHLLNPNPVPLKKLQILDRHKICSLLRLFVSRRKHDERARST